MSNKINQHMSNHNFQCLHVIWKSFKCISRYTVGTDTDQHRRIPLMAVHDHAPSVKTDYCQHNTACLDRGQNGNKAAKLLAEYFSGHQHYDRFSTLQTMLIKISKKRTARLPLDKSQDQDNKLQDAFRVAIACTLLMRLHMDESTMLHPDSCPCASQASPLVQVI